MYCPHNTLPCAITSSRGTETLLQPIVFDNFLETTSPTLLNLRFVLYGNCSESSVEDNPSKFACRDVGKLSFRAGKGGLPMAILASGGVSNLCGTELTLLSMKMLLIIAFNKNLDVK